MATDGPSLGGALVLGAIQGLTEFLPVSSSGHLVFAQAFIPVGDNAVLFDLVLHLGTLFPGFFFFRRDIAMVLKDLVTGDTPYWSRPGVRLSMLVLAATLPTGLIGLGFKDQFEAMFDDSLPYVQLINGVCFAITAIMLMLTRRAQDGTKTLMEVPASTAVWVGIAQGISIAPAISRSGATIAAAMFLGVEKETAFRLSFLMSFPAILGAFLLDARKVHELPSDLTPYVAGALTSMVIGYASLVALQWLVRKGRFSDFSWYVWLMAAASIGVWWFGVPI